MAKFKVGDKVKPVKVPSGYSWMLGSRFIVDSIDGGKVSVKEEKSNGMRWNFEENELISANSCRNSVVANAFPIKPGANINVMDALMDAYSNSPGRDYQDMCEALEKAGYVIDQGDRRGLGYQKADAVLKGGSRVTTVPAQIFASKTHYFDALAVFFDAGAKKILQQVLPADVLKGLENKTIIYDRFSDKFVKNSCLPNNTVVANAIAWKAKNR